MAQTNYTPIQLYYSTTAAAVPVNTNLANGELAINITDGKLYYKDNGGTVRLLASNATSAPVLSFSAGTTGFTPNTATTGAVTLAGTLATTNGGTGLTSFTSGGVVYASSTSALATGSSLVFDGFSLGIGASPTATLHVKNANLTSALLVGSQSDSASWGMFSVNGDTGSATGAGMYGKASASLYFNAPTSYAHVWTINGGEIGRFNTTGLGIGTSSPSVKLDITGYETRLLAPSSGKSISIYADANSSAIGYLSSGYLVFGKTTSTISTQFTEQMRLDSSGNLGLGVTPSAWSLSGLQAFQVKNGSIYGYLDEFGSQANTYYNAGWKYVANGFASQYVQASGTHGWLTAPSGTAGNAIPFTQAMTLDASGRLLVGTTSGSGATMFTVNQPAASTDAKTIVSVATGTNAAFTAFVNTTVTTVGTENSSGGSLVSGSSAYSTVIANNGAYPISFGTNNTERARITSDGTLLVGTTSASGNNEKVNITGNVADFFFRTSNTNASPAGMTVIYSNAVPNNTGNDFIYCQDQTTVRFVVRSNGGIANYSANDVNLSDRREKTNFAPATSYLDKICAIPVQTFNYIDQNMEEDGGLTLGVVAQDVQAVAPELVMESNWGTKEDPKMRLSIYQTDLQYALMKCIQEQQAIIESLKARLDAANL
jgi:hypothetical protein